MCLLHSDFPFSFSCVLLHIFSSYLLRPFFCQGRTKEGICFFSQPTKILKTFFMLIFCLICLFHLFLPLFGRGIKTRKTKKTKQHWGERGPAFYIKDLYCFVMSLQLFYEVPPEWTTISFGDCNKI